MVRAHSKTFFIIVVLFLFCPWQVRAAPDLFDVPEDIPILSLPLTLQVRLVNGEKEARVKSQEAIWMKISDLTMKARPGKEFVFRVKGSKGAKLVYVPLVSTFPKSRYREALKKSMELQKLGFHPEVKWAGRKLAHKGQVKADNIVCLLTLGQYEKEQEASAMMKALARKGMTSSLLSLVEKEAHGTIQVLDSQGNLLATSKDFLKMWSSSPITIKRVPYSTGIRGAKRKDRKYEGTILLQIGRDGRLEVVNELPIESYLKGVVPAEIGASSPLEALKAQSVAARTQALAKVGIKHLSERYLLCSEQHCQVFHGISGSNLMTDASVDKTMGHILMDSSTLQLIDTVYSSNCGGHTENNETAWNSFPDSSLRGVSDDSSSHSSSSSFFPQQGNIERWLKGNIDAYCNNSRARGYFRWRVTFTPGEMNAVVNKERSVGQVLDIVPLERGVSGRIWRLKIVGTKRTVEVEKELTIRRLLGGLKSSLFIVKSPRDGKDRPRAFEFIGGGFGHGVGMCQMGAIGRAQQGQDYQQILQHYYSNSEVRKLY